MKPALAILAAVLLLAGCGHASKPSDPFVGTWGLGPDTRLIITKVPRGYLVDARVHLPGTFIVFHPLRVVFTRHGDRLVGTQRMVEDQSLDTEQTAGRVSVTLTYARATGDLIYESTPPEYRYAYTRVAQSATTPSPAATASAPVLSLTSPLTRPARKDVTYTSRRFHFAISYDPTLLEGSVPIAEVFRGQLLLVLGNRGFDTGALSVSASDQGTALVGDLLRHWGKGPPSGNIAATDLNPWWLTAGSHARWIRVNGVPGELSSWNGGENVVYWLVQGSDVYVLQAIASAGLRKQLGTLLTSTAQSFRPMP
jgi:hypothetical protein